MFMSNDMCPSNYGQRLGKMGRPSLKLYLKATCMMLLVFTLLSVIGFLTVAAAKEAAPVAGVKETVYPANMFDDGKARHYEYKTNDGVTIRYFVMKSLDGVIRAAFDACVVCWREGKGYSQKDDFMICRNCGRRFKSTRINEVTGGCNPAPLTRMVENGKVIIKAESLMQGKPLFAFRGGR